MLIDPRPKGGTMLNAANFICAGELQSRSALLHNESDRTVWVERHGKNYAFTSTAFVVHTRTHTLDPLLYTAKCGLHKNAYIRMKKKIEWFYTKDHI